MTMEQPIEDGHDDATDTARIEGIIEQTRGDVALNHADDFYAVLRQRLSDAGIDVSDDELDRIVKR